MSDSRIPGFYRMDLARRIDALVEHGLLSADDARHLQSGQPLLNARTADKMIENVVGVFGLPLAVASNFRVNGRDCAVPMVVEEPSIVAGISGAARLMRAGEGIVARAMEPVLVGQVQLQPTSDIDAVLEALQRAKPELIEQANALLTRLVERGGGVRDIEFHRHQLAGDREMVVLHLLVDTRDAMGANIVNTLCESLTPAIEAIAAVKAGLRILSNLADQSLVTASVSLATADLALGSLSGEQIRDGIVAATEFADVDPYRAATHNKGVMNGIDAVAIATGNDWRSIEASAHAYAARSGRYRALTRWSSDDNGNLCGEIRIPLKVGIVGGSLLSNPGAALGLRIAGCDSATGLAELMAAAGLAQNFAALRALVSRGIQDGHMRLHARSVAISVGAPPQHFNAVVDGLIASGDIKDWKARELVEALQSDASFKGDVTASGKIILLGEHAAVYGKHVLALPLPGAMAATATVAEAGFRLTVEAWGLDETFTPGTDAGGSAAAIVSAIVNRLELADRGCHILVSPAIPAAVGLGASAALATVIVRALDKCFDLRLDDATINSVVFDCERQSHGDPSGVDNTISVYGRPALFRKGDPAEVTELELRQPPPLVVAASGARGRTRDLVARVRAGYEANPNLYARVFDQIDRLSVAGADALKNSEYDALGAMMNVCQGLLNGIQVSTPELERMADIARRSGATGAKLTGAGGGGCVVALCPGCEEDVASAWRQSGYDILQFNG